MGCSLSRTTAALTDEDIEFLTQNTQYSAKEIRDWYSAFLKDCPDGKLKKNKFIEIYKMFFNTANADHFCEQVYRTFDADDDGHISFKEFLLAIGVTTTKEPREKLKWAFKMYDINNDGLIEVSEMGKIIKVSSTKIRSCSSCLFTVRKHVPGLTALFVNSKLVNESRSCQKFNAICLKR